MQTLSVCIAHLFYLILELSTLASVEQQPEPFLAGR